MRKALERAEAMHLPSRTPGRDPDPSNGKIDNRQQGNRTDDHDGADPMQEHFMEEAPGSASRLYQDAFTRFGDDDCPLDPGRLSQQVLLLYRARIWIDHGRLRC